MIDISKIDYTKFDQPEILGVVFHPRREQIVSQPGGTPIDLLIPVEKNVTIGGRFHPIERSAPNILFFHGNGEIVADYDDIGPMFNNIGINFMVVDYRGYGRSTGMPSFTSMMTDAHLIFEWARAWLKRNNHGGPLIVMGRSLGSASAFEISAHYAENIHGLIIESGFSRIGPLLGLLGIDINLFGIREEDGPRNLDKMRNFYGPTLIIHAEYDHIIPFEEGLELFEASPRGNKRLVKIPNADHNTIFFRGMSEYLTAIEELAKNIIE